jgi:type I restriction enzyme S subunit
VKGMSLNWEYVKLGNIVKTNESLYNNKENWMYVNYLDTGNITNNVIENIQYIDLKEEKLPSRAKRKVQLNSIIYSTVRPNQRHYGIIKSHPDNFLVSTGFAVINVDEVRADADYIFYFLSQDCIVEKLHAIAEQSTSAYPSIKASDIEDIDVILPPIDVQRKIASILKIIDEKLAQNRTINRNLLNVALRSRLFKYQCLRHQVHLT